MFEDFNPGWFALILSIVAIISPIFTAIINNRTKNKELKHQKDMQKMKDDQEYRLKELEIYETVKMNKIDEYMKTAGIRIGSHADQNAINNFNAANAALLPFISDRTSLIMSSFYQKLPFYSQIDEETKDDFWSMLQGVADEIQKNELHKTE